MADPSFVAVVDDELAPVTPPVKTFHQRTIVSLLVSTGLTILFLQFSNMIVASISAVTIVAIVIGLISSGELRERLVASSICFAMLLPCIICFSAIYRTIF